MKFSKEIKVLLYTEVKLFEPVHQSKTLNSGTSHLPKFVRIHFKYQPQMSSLFMEGTLIEKILKRLSELQQFGEFCKYF